MFFNKKIKLKIRRTLEQLIDVYFQAERLAEGKPELYEVEALKAVNQIRGACLVLGLREPDINVNRVTIYDIKGNMLIDR